MKTDWWLLDLGDKTGKDGPRVQTSTVISPGDAMYNRVTYSTVLLI